MGLMERPPAPPGLHPLDQSSSVPTGQSGSGHSAVREYFQQLMMSDDDFSLEAWATEHKLNRPTTAALRKEDFKTPSVLKLMTRSDINRLGITAGQARALQTGLIALGNATGLTVEEVEPVPLPGQQAAQNPVQNVQEAREAAARNVDATMAEAGEALDRFLEEEEDPLVTKQFGVSSVGGAAASFSTYKFDPRMSLTVKATKRKAHTIFSFLQEEAKERINKRKRERMSLSEGPNGLISLKAKETGKMYVSIDEWSGANTRILAHMPAEGELARDDVEYYLAYTVNVMDLVPRFEWMTIIEYDTRYRELQAQHNFPWGTDILYLENRILVPRRFPLNNKEHGRGERFKTKGESSTQICKMFAIKGACPFGEGCRFRHERVADYNAPAQLKNGQ